MRKKVLYLHGLNSKLYDDRREVMQKFDLEIFAPQIDYEGNPNALTELLEEYEVDMVIGSSAGGLGGYYFSGLKQIPALLFNPALPFRHYMPNIPQMPPREAFLQVVIGAKDTEVSPTETFNFLTKNESPTTPLEIHWINTLAHRFSIDIFEKELKCFLENV